MLEPPELLLPSGYANQASAMLMLKGSVVVCSQFVHQNGKTAESNLPSVEPRRVFNFSPSSISSSVMEGLC